MAQIMNQYDKKIIEIKFQRKKSVRFFIACVAIAAAGYYFKRTVEGEMLMIINLAFWAGLIGSFFAAGDLMSQAKEINKQLQMKKTNRGF